MPVASLVALLRLPLALLALHASARAVARQSVRLFGVRLHLALFAWPGTLLHEASHVVACWCFRHRIERVRWFDPRATDGALGAVEHAYDPASRYQRLGTIAIGLAPLLAGTAVLLAAAHWLLGLPVGLPVDLAASSPLAPLAAAAAAVPREPWRWTAFAYLSLSVGGAMALSRADVRGMGPGVVLLLRWLAVAGLLVFAASWLAGRSSAAGRPLNAGAMIPWLRQAALGCGRWLAPWSARLGDALALAAAVNVAGALLLAAIRQLRRLVGQH